MRPRLVHIVLSEGGAMVVLGGYWNATHAGIHARTVTGASTIVVEVLDRLPESVRDLLFEDFEGDDTPLENEVVPMPERSSETDHSK